MMIFDPRNVPYVTAIRRCTEIGFTPLDFTGKQVNEN